MKKRIVNRFPINKSFGSRLIYLYDNAGLLSDGKIDFKSVAVSLYDKGLCLYSSVDDDIKLKQSNLKNTVDTLRKHIDVTSAEHISGKWLHIYCSYFGCSCDFLMGYIDLPLHENTNISNVTGLSNAAVNALIKDKKEQFHIIDTLNLLLARTHIIEVRRLFLDTFMFMLTNPKYFKSLDGTFKDDYVILESIFDDANHPALNGLGVGLYAENVGGLFLHNITSHLSVIKSKL